MRLSWCIVVRTDGISSACATSSRDPAWMKSERGGERERERGVSMKISKASEGKSLWLRCQRYQIARVRDTVITVMREREKGGPVLDSITTGEKSYFLAVRSRLRKTNKATHRFNPLQIVRIRWEWLAQPFRSRTRVTKHLWDPSMESVCTIFLSPSFSSFSESESV